MIGWVLLATIGWSAEPGDYTGRYTAAATDVEQAVDAAVEEGAMQFSLLFRGIARKKLATSLQASPWLGIEVTAGEITISSARRPNGVKSTLNGPAAPIKADDGEPATVRRWMEDGLLKGEACNSKGECIDTSFRLEGDALVLTRVTRSKQLTSPVTMVLRYTRATP